MFTPPSCPVRMQHCVVRLNFCLTIGRVDRTLFPVSLLVLRRQDLNRAPRGPAFFACSVQRDQLKLKCSLSICIKALVGAIIDFLWPSARGSKRSK